MNFSIAAIAVFGAWTAADAVTLSIPHNGGPTDTASERLGGTAMCTAAQLSKVSGYLLDLDGTMYSQSGLLQGVQKFFDWLEETDTPYILLSNGFKTREGVAAKFASPKYKIRQVIDPNSVHTAGIALAKYMKENAPKGSKIYAVGTSIEYSDGQRDFLTRILRRAVPAQLFDTWEVRTDMTENEIYEWAHLSRDLKVPVFVVLAAMGDANDKFGDDPVTGKSGYSTMRYDLMTKINTLLRNDAYFVVGAPDVAHSQPRNVKYPTIDTAWPTMGGYEGLFLQSAEMFPGTAKERRNHACTGKGGSHGARYMMEPGIELLRSRGHIPRSNMMIIGDNFGTDIKAGNDAGIMSMLVLEGAHQLEDAANWSSRPTCFLPHVGYIPQLLPGGPGSVAPGDEGPVSRGSLVQDDDQFESYKDPSPAPSNAPSLFGLGTVPERLDNSASVARDLAPHLQSDVEDNEQQDSPSGKTSAIAVIVDTVAKAVVSPHERKNNLRGELKDEGGWTSKLYGHRLSRAEAGRQG